MSLINPFVIKYKYYSDACNLMWETFLFKDSHKYTVKNILLKYSVTKTQF